MSPQNLIQSTDEQIASIAKELNYYLKLLDDMKLWDSAAHLSMAIEALPGQSAITPDDRQELNS